MQRSHWEFTTLAHHSQQTQEEGRFVPITDRDQDSGARIFAIQASQLQIQHLRQPENIKCDFLTYNFLKT